MNLLLLIVFALSNILWWNECREWRKSYHRDIDKMLDQLEQAAKQLELSDTKIYELENRPKIYCCKEEHI